MHRIHRASIIKYIIFLSILLETIQLPRDPDLGWHLRYGQYFFAYGHVLRDNIFSYIWPSFHWVQASWGYDLFVYQLFIHGGFISLAIASAILTATVFVIITWPIKRLSPLLLFFLALLFLALAAPLWGGSLRTPSLSTIFMALVIVLSDRIYNPRGRPLPLWVTYTLPLLFLIWANVHGGFSLGLILLTIQWILFGFLQKEPRDKTLWRHYGLVLALSWITPLINPWGWQIYEEAFRHSSNPALNVISEWMPLTTMPVESVLTGLAVLATIWLAFVRKNIRYVPYIAMVLVTTVLAFGANRFVIVLAVLIVYFWSTHAPALKMPFWRRKTVRLGTAIALISIFFADMFFFQRYFPPPEFTIGRYGWNEYCLYTAYCSENITAIMLTDPPKGNGFHPYNYGGYLIWRVPAVKTFIDGRMISWEQAGASLPAVEGDWVFMQQSPVAFRKFEDEYHFTWVIIPTASDITRYMDDLVTAHLWIRRYQDALYSYYTKVGMR